MPPPDDPAFIAASKPATTRAWFPAQHVTSYQSGGVPTFNTSQAGGLGAVEAAEVESGVNSWETAYGMRVEVLAAFAYLLGPISVLHLTAIFLDSIPVGSTVDTLNPDSYIGFLAWICTIFAHNVYPLNRDTLTIHGTHLEMAFLDSFFLQ
ncbi:hypothetical protein NLI96_g4866 [Meripilus lineatus]|uniref:Uncharacterized protein n=1 Tax=Meripilus lineatus TaxID=2056292 RepID=A0AAD5YJI1_9APHY|nr:hypothetical protein NLI96_g4866 [Physisporinus lineatus]